MIFEPDDFDLILKSKLKNELDNDNICVTEELIQRTLTAVKDDNISKDKASDNIDEESSNLDAFNELSSAEDTSVYFINKKYEAIKSMNSAYTGDRVSSRKFKKKYQKKMCLSEKDNFSNKKTVKWIKTISWVAACFLFFLIFKTMGKNGIRKDSESSMENFTASSESASNQTVSDGRSEMQIGTDDDVYTTEDAKKEAGTVADKSKNDTVTGEENVDESVKEESNSSLTFGGENQENEEKDTEIHSIVNQKNSDMTDPNDKNVTTDTSVILTFEEIVLAEKSFDADKDTVTYIVLSDKNIEETASIQEITELLDENREERKTGKEEDWVYKIFLQNNDFINVYFISDSGTLNEKLYDISGNVNEAEYQLKDTEHIIEAIKRMGLNEEALK